MKTRPSRSKAIAAWSRAKERGVQAAKKGGGMNPYSPGSYCAILWNIGFQSVTK